MNSSKMVYRYYTLYRPPMPGAIPRGAINVQTMGSRPYIPEIGHSAWGIVDYERRLTAAEIRQYELAPANMIQQPMEVMS